MSASIGVRRGPGDETADDLLRERRRGDVRRQAPGQGTLGDLRVEDVRRRARAAGDGGARSGRRSSGASSLCTTSRSSISRRGALYGVEALLRWEHPQYGLLLPQHFIPLAEETGLIVAARRWVLDEACRQVQAWRLAYPHVPLSVSVNISGRQLQGAGDRGGARATPSPPAAWIRRR